MRLPDIDGVGTNKSFELKLLVYKQYKNQSDISACSNVFQSF